VFGIGTVYNNYWVMFAGRVIFGLGGENNLVVQCFVVEKWFKGNIVSIAFGMVMIFNLAGTASNNFFTPISFELLDGNFAGVFAFSFIALGISIISSVTYIIMDIKYRDVYIMAEEPEIEYLDANGNKESMCTKFKNDLKKISPTFWFIMLAQISTSNVYYQFMNFGTAYAEVRFGNTYDVSKNYLTMIPFVIMICMLILSIFTQVYGQKGKMLIASGILSLGVTILLYFFPKDCGLW